MFISESSPRKGGSSIFLGSRFRGNDSEGSWNDVLSRKNDHAIQPQNIFSHGQLINVRICNAYKACYG
jgi:hypothetical protein